jgi:hypothetical protein
LVRGWFSLPADGLIPAQSSIGNNMWLIIFALPDLNLNEPVGDENIAIVPKDDSRITKITKNSPFSKALVENFEDQFGQKQNPALLIISDTAPQQLREIDAIVGFRNIFALSTIIKGHEHSLTSKFVAYPVYSDYFDFYPITISKDDDGFLTKSPSVLGFDDERKSFRGQTSPSLAGPAHVSAGPPGFLFDQLQKVWSRRYLRKRYGEWSTRALFRSLEMAYQATSMPFKNYSTMYDFGASASLWVSALEILSHPKKGSANLSTVLDLIGKYDWIDKDVKRRAYVVKYGGKRTNVNLAQKLYKELYDTRNAFLHGNPVTPNRLKPFRRKEAQAITRFAPLLYEVALISFLEQFKPKRKYKRIDMLKEYGKKSVTERKLAAALLKSKQNKKGIR